MPPVQDLTADRPLAPDVALPGALARHRVAIAVLALALLSFALPSAPTYDPWAWIVWGREILHLDLNTVHGPSWKPLPLLFTTPFALAGGMAPDLWLFVARVGAIASVVVVFRLVRALGGGVAGGLAAAVAYALSAWTIRNGWMGNSEGMLVACALGAAERHLAGHRRVAFGLLTAASLLRPEVWPFLGLYGLWLAWRMPAARVLVACGFASLPLLWLLPEKWGSGDLLRAMHRAQEPVAGSPGASDHPFTTVLSRFVDMLPVTAWIGLGALALALVLRCAPGRRQALLTLALLAAGGVLAVEVALTSSGVGFTGGTRYLILPAAVVVAAAGTGIGWLARAAGAARLRGRAAVIAPAAACAVAFAVPGVVHFGSSVAGLGYQARVADDLAAAVRHAGGQARLLACGHPYTDNLEVPKVAWQLHLHTGQVAGSSVPRRTPAVLFESRFTPHAPLDPQLAGARTLGTSRYWRIAGVCRTPGSGA